MKKINHIAILIDRSDSTRHIAPGIIKQFNMQASKINERSKAEGQQTHLSLYTFSSVADRPLLFEVPLDFVQLRNITTKDYDIGGATALLDSVGMAIEDLSQFHKELSHSADHSFLLICLTDGEENVSVKYPKHEPQKLARLMMEKLNTDMWTFVFLVPTGAARPMIEKFKIHPGNVQEWDTTDKGVEEIGRKTSAGLDNFFTGRTKGIRSTKAFFTDLSNVTARDVKSALTEVTSFYHKTTVAMRDCDGVDQHGHDCVVIEKYCDRHFHEYVLGNAFYELAKKEKIQDHKPVIIEDRKTGRMYGGDDARRLLGFPELGEITVKPGDHGNFRIYVKSTSVNRKLIKDTCVLYKKR